MNNLSIYRFYKGENENPFNQDQQNPAFMFWFYESIFDRDFKDKDSSDWYEFFSMNDLGSRFMKILSEEDYNRPTEAKKKQVFELWLEYLFTFKIYPEYGGRNLQRDAYYSSSIQ